MNCRLLQLKLIQELLDLQLLEVLLSLGLTGDVVRHKASLLELTEFALETESDLLKSLRFFFLLGPNYLKIPLIGTEMSLVVRALGLDFLHLAE